MTHHDVTEGMRQFRPGVSCDHNWAHGPDAPVYGIDLCLQCGATCVRASDGTIEEYDSGREY